MRIAVQVLVAGSVAWLTWGAWRCHVLPVDDPRFRGAYWRTVTASGLAMVSVAVASVVV